jgi:hypothetical protein
VCSITLCRPLVSGFKYPRPDAEEQKGDPVLMETRGGWRTRGGWGTKFPGLKLLKFSRSGQVSSLSGRTGFNRLSNYHSKMAHYFCEAYRPAYRPHRPCRPTENGLGRPRPSSLSARPARPTGLQAVHRPAWPVGITA